MTSSTDRGAPVRLLPPLIFLVPLIAGIGYDRIAPWRLATAEAWRAGLAIAGITLLVGGFALMGWAAVVMTRHRTTVIPWGRADHLMTGGPFRFTRNPIYVGDLLAYLGAALVVGTWWPLALLPLPLYVVQRFVIEREEAYLLERFGEPYAAYLTRVRRWGVV